MCAELLRAQSNREETSEEQTSVEKEITKTTITAMLILRVKMVLSTNMSATTTTMTSLREARI